MADAEEAAARAARQERLRYSALRENVRNFLENGLNILEENTPVLRAPEPASADPGDTIEKDE